MVGLAQGAVNNDQLYISLLKGSIQIARGYCTPGASTFLFCTFAMQATVALKVGESVSVLNENTGYQNSALVRAVFTHFNGWLVQENLSSVLS